MGHISENNDMGCVCVPAYHLPKLPPLIFLIPRSSNSHQSFTKKKITLVYFMLVPTVGFNTCAKRRVFYGAEATAFSFGSF